MIHADIIFKLKLLAQEHKTTGDDLDVFKDAELIEQEAEQIIVEYCEAKGYLVNGFPTEKRQLPEDELEEDWMLQLATFVQTCLRPAPSARDASSAAEVRQAFFDFCSGDVRVNQRLS